MPAGLYYLGSFTKVFVATKSTRDPRIGKVDHVSHTFGTLACAAISAL